MFCSKKLVNTLLLVLFIFTGSNMFSSLSNVCSCSDNFTETQLKAECCDSMRDESMQECQPDKNISALSYYYDGCSASCHIDIPQTHYISKDTYTNQRNLLKAVGILNIEPLLNNSLKNVLPSPKIINNTTNYLALLKTIILIV